MSEQSSAPRSVDRLVARTLAAFPFRFTVAEDDDERLVAYRLRQAAVIERGWNPPNGPAVDAEEDAYDNRAVHVIGWHDDTPVSTGRIVLPPGLLPTEEACALRIEPHGRVVDVGRMVVAPSHRDPHAGAFVALMARLYLEVRKQGFTVACGMMAPDVRHLVRQLGVQLDVLGPDRPYWATCAALSASTSMPAPTASRSVGRARQNQNRVDTAEAERVGQPVPVTDRPRLAADHIDLHLGIDTDKTRHRWHEPVA